MTDEKKVYRKAHIVSRGGIKTIEFSDGSILAGVTAVSIDMFPTQVVTVKIELVEFTTDIKGLERLSTE
jgi:hypothetical protein